MRVITDWHVHSKYSRACSQQLTLENNALWCEKKGVNILGTADFTHPKWFSEIEEKLEEVEQGMFSLHQSPSLASGGRDGGMRYMLTTELSQIYSRGGKTRRIHNLIFAPSIDTVRKIIAMLERRGCNLSADGRPIIGVDSEELAKELFAIDEKILLIPAHAWTPWFSVFGSKSGFDSIEECFGSMADRIYAIETGLSSDPAMNRTLSALDDLFLISNSDAHSPHNFGREANVFEIPEGEVTYDEFFRILREHDTSRFVSTIEFFPEEGKYHYDGHADCQFFCAPAETKKLGNKCPKCGKALTIGVLNRVSELDDRPIQSAVHSQFPSPISQFYSIVPLEILIADSLGIRTVSSKKVQAIYEELITKLGNEFSILLDVPADEIRKVHPTVGEAIERVRAGKLRIRPGYDGVYGKVQVFSDTDRIRVPKQVLNKISLVHGRGDFRN